MFKKILIILLIPVVLIVAVLSIYLKKINYFCKHTETYTEVIDVGSCTKKQIIGTYCSKCKKLLEEKEGDLGHTNLVLNYESNHYCHYDYFYKYFICKDCNVIKREVIKNNKTEHKFNWVYYGDEEPLVFEAYTYSMYSYQVVYKCSVCGFEKEIEYRNTTDINEAYELYYIKFPERKK